MVHLHHPQVPQRVLHYFVIQLVLVLVPLVQLELARRLPQVRMPPPVQVQMPWPGSVEVQP